MNSTCLMIVVLLSTLSPLAIVAAGKQKVITGSEQKLVVAQSIAHTQQLSAAKNAMKSAEPTTWWEKELVSGKPLSENLLRNVPGFPTWFACSLFLTDAPDKATD